MLPFETKVQLFYMDFDMIYICVHLLVRLDHCACNNCSLLMNTELLGRRLFVVVVDMYLIKKY